MDAVVARTDPAGAGPDVAVLVAADAVRKAAVVFGDVRDLLDAVDHRPHTLLDIHHHRGELAAVLQRQTAIHLDDIPDFDVAFGVVVVRSACIGRVNLFVIGREAQAVRLVDVVGELHEPARLRVNPVDGFLLIRLNRTGCCPPAFIVHQAAVARIRKEDVAVGVDGSIVGSVKRFAVVLAGEHSPGSVVVVSNHAARQMFERNLPALKVECVAVAVV